jgi:hypothetical protein
MEKTITIIVAVDGNTTIEANGYTGGSCVKATQPLKDALIGEQPDKQTLKPEYNLPEIKAAVGVRQ